MGARVASVAAWYSPAVGPDGTVYLFENNAGLLVAVDPSGVQRWTFEAGTPVQGSVAIGTDGTLYFASDAGTVFAVTSSGERRWTVELGETIQCDPALDGDGTLYLVGSGSLWAVSHDGTFKWRFQDSSPIGGSVAIGRDDVLYVTEYVTSTSGRIRVRWWP